MPNIIGQFDSVSSTSGPLEGHVAHLRHLAHQHVARQILREQFCFSRPDSEKHSQLLSAHVAQALEFHAESIAARPSIRPVLQYYSYLNLGVACILAYRPPDFHQYRKHGLGDQTHKLTRLAFSSPIVEVRRGAVPLFHSIISGESLEGRTLRFSELVASVPILAHELATAFGKTTQTVLVRENVQEMSKRWRSVVTFQCEPDGARTQISLKRRQRAMPRLSTDYKLHDRAASRLTYCSRNSWSTQEAAWKPHRVNCLRMVNYGGHRFQFRPPYGVEISYRWHGVARIPLMPTLTASLCLSFALSSMVRYRPVLLAKAMSSPLNLLIDTFVQESDGFIIPALRNLLFREELCIGRVAYL